MNDPDRNVKVDIILSDISLMRIRELKNLIRDIISSYNLEINRLSKLLTAGFVFKDTGYNAVLKNDLNRLKHDYEEWISIEETLNLYLNKALKDKE